MVYTSENAMSEECGGGGGGEKGEGSKMFVCVLG